MQGVNQGWCHFTNEETKPRGGTQLPRPGTEQSLEHVPQGPAMCWFGLLHVHLQAHLIQQSPQMSPLEVPYQAASFSLAISD